MSEIIDNEQAASSFTERFIAEPRPVDVYRSEQEAAFYGVVLVTYLTIATLIPSDAKDWGMDAMVMEVEQEEDWEDIEDDDAPLTPAQSFEKYIRVSLFQNAL